MTSSREDSYLAWYRSKIDIQHLTRILVSFNSDRRSRERPTAGICFLRGEKATKLVGCVYGSNFRTMLDPDRGSRAPCISGAAETRIGLAAEIRRFLSNLIPAHLS